MRTIIFLMLALLTVPAATSHAGLPLNALTNGGFDTGSAGWLVKGTGSLAGPILVAPGADGAGFAIQTREVGAGSGWVHQDIAPAAASPVTLLDFSARIDGNLTNPMAQAIAVVAQHNLQTGIAETTVSVSFNATGGWLVAYCNGFILACAPVPFVAPSDGLWHHYQVVLSSAGGIGILLIDGVQVAAVTNGAPASVSAPTRVLFGDVAYHIRGVSTTMSWDDIYYGPAI